MLSKSWKLFAVLVAILTGPATTASAASFKYSTPTGFFTQEDPFVNANPPDYTKIEFGLLNRTYPTDDPSLSSQTNWQRFTHYLTTLNSSPPVRYKLLYLARHGEAHHNTAQSHYGTPCWNCYWSHLDGNGSVVWRDAEMTLRGEAQVMASHAFWRDVAPHIKIPWPGSWYVSPMARTLATAEITWGGLNLTEGGFKPVVKERLRESINACTCAWRHPKSWIAARFPSYRFEEGFTEEDELFTGKTVESASAQAERITKFLDGVFSTDGNSVVSVTTHGVNINPLLGIVGHPNPGFNITTGQAIAVLVRVERLDEEVEAKVDPPALAESCGRCGP